MGERYCWSYVRKVTPRVFTLLSVGTTDVTKVRLLGCCGHLSGDVEGVWMVSCEYSLAPIPGLVDLVDLDGSGNLLFRCGPT